MNEIEREIIEGLPELILGLALIAVALIVRAVLPGVLERRSRDRRVFFWVEGAVPPLMYLLIACAICSVALALVTMLPEAGSPRVNKFIEALPETIEKITRIAAIVFIGWAIIGANKRSSFFLTYKNDDNEASRLALIRFASALLTVVVVAFMVIMVITELGFNVTALVTGLGLGGLTVALAAKDAAANFFGGAVIVMERPFEIGDWIKTDLIEGTVIDINMRSTTVRNSTGSSTVVPNSTISNSAITNWTRVIERRRIEMELGFEYGAAPADIQAFTLAAKAMLEADEDVDPEDVVVRLFELGEYSLTVKLYCFTKCTAYKDFLAVKERILYNLMALAEQNHLRFAFPTQTLEMREKESKE
jgi:MscS family membrane protein